MAVQKSRKSRAKRNMRRANDSVASATLAIDSTTGETHLRHHVTASGMYRGKQVVAQAEAEEDE
jgi:large subunit ribosomal protein L32